MSEVCCSRHQSNQRVCILPAMRAIPEGDCSEFRFVSDFEVDQLSWEGQRAKKFERKFMKALNFKIIFISKK